MQQPSEFLALLEAERNDVSYRYGGRLRQPQEVTIFKPERIVVRPDTRRERKMFNAGRYAAGARDRIATAADKWLQKELSK